MIEKANTSDNTKYNKAIAEKIITEYKKYHTLKNRHTVIEVFIELGFLLVLSFFLSQVLRFLKIVSPEPVLVIIFVSFVLTSMLILPRLLITVLIFYRTGYSGLLVTIFDIASSLLFNIVMCILLVYFKWWSNNLLELLISITAFLLVIGVVLHRLFKKKSFFNTNTITDYWSTILSQQSLILHDKMDGYSQRPVFSSIMQLKENFYSDSDFYKEIFAYIHFLARQGEIIGWKRKENTITYFPRVLINYPGGISHLFASFRLLKTMFFMEDLTAVSINLISDEISLFIKPEDYELFNNVTFHVFCQEFLERTINSIDAFIKKDFTKSYLLLYPINPEVKKVITNIQKNNLLTRKGQQQKNIDIPMFLKLTAGLIVSFGSALMIMFGFLLLITGGVSIGVVLDVLFLNTNYEYLKIFYVSIPVFILFITSLILFKAGIDLANLKAWAYVASFIAFLLLLLFLIVVMMPLYIFKSDLRGILIDLAVIGYVFYTIDYLYRIRNTFDLGHVFISRFIKTNITGTKINK